MCIWIGTDRLTCESQIGYKKVNDTWRMCLTRNRASVWPRALPDHHLRITNDLRPRFLRIARGNKPVKCGGRPYTCLFIIVASYWHTLFNAMLWQTASIDSVWPCRIIKKITSEYFDSNIQRFNCNRTGTIKNMSIHYIWFKLQSKSTS